MNSIYKIDLRRPSKKKSGPTVNIGTASGTTTDGGDGESSASGSSAATGNGFSGSMGGGEPGAAAGGRRKSAYRRHLAPYHQMLAHRDENAMLGVSANWGSSAHPKDPWDE